MKYNFIIILISLLVIINLAFPNKNYKKEKFETIPVTYGTSSTSGTSSITGTPETTVQGEAEKSYVPLLSSTSSSLLSCCCCFCSFMAIYLLTKN